MTLRSGPPFTVPIRRLHRFLLAELSPDSARGRMVRSAGVTAALKAGSTLLAFGASLIYARALKPHGYGLYAYVMAWAALLTIPAGLGLPSYLVREGAKASAGLRLLQRWADLRVLGGGLAAALLLALAVLLPQAAGARWVFVIAAPLPLLNNLGAVRRALLQSQGRVARSEWPLLILGPALMLAALTVLWLWQGRIYPVEVMMAMTSAAIVPLAVSHFQLNRAEPAPEPDGAVRVRVRAALPFMWLGGLYLLSNRVDLIMLGALKGGHDAGIYAVAARAAELVTFFLGAANMVLAPRIARLYQNRNYAMLQRLLTGAALRIFLLTLPVALLIIIFARELLRDLYGAAYMQGAIALRLLAAAQLCNVLVGSTGTILNMTGHEKQTLWAVGVSVGLGVALNGLLIPFFGLNGAAVATAVSLVTWNLLLWYWTRKYLRLHPSALGI